MNPKKRVVSQLEHTETDSIPHLEQPVLQEPTLDGYRFPEVDEICVPDWEEKARRMMDQQQDHFLLTFLGNGLFERTWALRGFENALIDSIARPAFYRKLVERVFEHHMALLDKVLRLPLDGVMFSDDFAHQNGIMIGRKRWCDYFKPLLRRMYRKVHQAGKYAFLHMCGSEIEIMPDLIEAGLDVYQSVQPEARDNSPYTLKQRYGDRMVFWGGVGSQYLLPFGTPKRIKVEVRRLCTEMARGGGYILGPAKPLLPETPTENAVALIEAFAEQAGASL